MSKMTEGQLLVQSAIESLLRLAIRHKVAIAGFGFAADPPMIINFGNCTDAHKIELYERLVELAEQQREKGFVQNTIAGEVN